MAVGSLVTVACWPSLHCRARNGSVAARRKCDAAAPQQQQAQTIETQPLQTQPQQQTASRANDAGRNRDAAGYFITGNEENRTDVAYRRSEYPDSAGATGANSTGSVDADSRKMPPQQAQTATPQPPAPPAEDAAKVAALREAPRPYGHAGKQRQLGSRDT